MTSVPDDPNMTPEVRRFLDDQQRAAADLQTQLTAALAAIPALATEAEAEAGMDNVNYLSSLRVAQSVAALGPFARFIHVRDEKPSGNDGGTFTQDIWQIRVLNTVVTNRISGASLTANEVTLPAGRYFVNAGAPSFAVIGVQARLYNVTSSSVLIYGQTGRALRASTSGSAISPVLGEFTLAATSNVRLEHRCQTTQATTGLGPQNAFGNIEVYAEMIIGQLA